MFYIRARKLWRAALPKSITYDRWNHGVTLVLHHTAGVAPTKLAEVTQELRNVQRSHMRGDRGEKFSDIGYNYIIDRMGRVWEGRGWNVRGAHTLAHNTQTIGVSLMGNLDVKKPSIAQRVALLMLAYKLRKQGAKILQVRGHREMPGQSTACPGRHGMTLVRLLRKKLGVS